MIVDLAKIEMRENPVMFILNPEDRRISAVSCPHDVNLKLNYSEISELTFSVHAYTDDKPTTGYKHLVGLNQIEVPNVGIFVIMDPVTTGDGENEVKKITAYSREYELTYKNVSLPNKTYAFFSPDPDVYSVADMVHEYAPSWTFGDKDKADTYYEACEVYDRLVREADALGGSKLKKLGNVELDRKMLWTDDAPDYLVTNYIRDNPSVFGETAEGEPESEAAQEFRRTHTNKRRRTEFRKVHVEHDVTGTQGQPLWTLEVDLLLATLVKVRNDVEHPEGVIKPITDNMIMVGGDNLNGIGQSICSALEKAGIAETLAENKELGITAEKVLEMDSREYDVLVGTGGGGTPTGDWIWVQDCIAGINCDIIPGADDDLDSMLRLAEILSDSEELDSNGKPTAAPYARQLAMSAGEAYGEKFDVPEALKAEYRTYEASDNLYNFLMSTVQTSYNCLFDFETQRRVITARHARSLRDFDEEDYPDVDPVYISFANLAQEMEIEEDSSGIFNCLDVNGAEGVDIRSVNPLGSNKIYNLDYIVDMPSLFKMRDGFIDEYRAWQNAVEMNEVTYRTLVAERALKNTKKNILSAKRNEIDTAIEKAKVEYQSATEVYELLQAEFDAWKAANPEKKDEAWTSSYNDLRDWRVKRNVLLGVLILVSAAGTDIDYEIREGEAEIKRLSSQIEEVVSACSPESSFSANNLKIFNRLVKESSLQETTFVYPDSDMYVSPDSLDADADYTLEIISADGNSVSMNELVGTTNTRSNRTTFALNGGRIRLIEYRSVDEETVEASVLFDLSAVYTTLDYVNNAILLSAQMAPGIVADRAYETANLTVIAKADGAPVVTTRGDATDYQTSEWLPAVTVSGIQQITVDKKPTRIDAVTIGGATYMQNDTATAGETFTYNSSTGLIKFASGEAAISGDVHVYYKAEEARISGVSVDLNSDGADAMYYAPQEIKDLLAGITILTDGIQIYLTAPTDMAAKQQISAALYDFGKKAMRKISQPSYTFRATVDNFFSLQEFVAFSSALTLGNACYLEPLDGKVYKPIVTGVEFDFEHPENLTMTFGDRYVKTDSAYKLSDLIQKGASMGEKLDASKYTYSAFVGTGAKDTLMDVVKSDVVSLDEKSVESEDGALKMTATSLEAKKVSDQHKSPFLSPHDENQIVLKENNLRIGERESGIFDLEDPSDVAIGSLDREYDSGSASVKTNVYGINGDKVYVRTKTGSLIPATERIAEIDNHLEELFASEGGVATGDVNIGGRVADLEWRSGVYYTGVETDSYTPTETPTLHYSSAHDTCQYCELANEFKLPVVKLTVGEDEYLPADAAVKGSKFRYDSATEKILFAADEDPISDTITVYYEDVGRITEDSDYCWATIEVNGLDRFVLDGFVSNDSYLCYFANEWGNPVILTTSNPRGVPDFIDENPIPVGPQTLARVPLSNGAAMHCVYTVTAPETAKYLHINSYVPDDTKYKTSCVKLGRLNFEYGDYIKEYTEDNVQKSLLLPRSYKAYVSNGSFVLRHEGDPVYRLNADPDYTLIEAAPNGVSVYVPFVAEGTASFVGDLTALGAVIVKGGNGVQFRLASSNNVLTLLKLTMSGSTILSSETIFTYDTSGKFNTEDIVANSLSAATSVTAATITASGTLTAGGRNVNDRQSVSKADFITSTVISGGNDTKIYTVNGRVVGKCLLDAVTLDSSGSYTVGTIAQAYRPFVKQCNRLHDGKNVFINTDGTVVIQGDADKAYASGEATIYIDYAY